MRHSTPRHKYRYDAGTSTWAPSLAPQMRSSRRLTSHPHRLRPARAYLPGKLRRPINRACFFFYFLFASVGFYTSFPLHHSEMRGDIGNPFLFYSAVNGPCSLCSDVASGAIAAAIPDRSIFEWNGESVGRERFIQLGISRSLPFISFVMDLIRPRFPYTYLIAAESAGMNLLFIRQRAIRFAKKTRSVRFIVTGGEHLNNLNWVGLI